MQQEIASLRKVNRLQNWCKENLGPLAGFTTTIIGAVTLLVFMLKRRLHRIRNGVHHLRRSGAVKTVGTTVGKAIGTGTVGGISGKVSGETIGKKILNKIKPPAPKKDDEPPKKVSPPKKPTIPITPPKKKKTTTGLVDTSLKHVENGIGMTINNIWLSVAASILGGYIVYRYTKKK